MKTNDANRQKGLAASIDVEPLPDDATGAWPIEYDGMDFYPIPESWISHPNAQDRDQEVDNDQLYAVSAAASGGFIVVRYLHPTHPGVLHKKTNWLQISGGVVPRALATVGWPRSLPIDTAEPQDYREPCERRHMVELWSERSDEIKTDAEMRDLLADGGTLLEDL